MNKLMALLFVSSFFLGTVAANAQGVECQYDVVGTTQLSPTYTFTPDGQVTFGMDTWWEDDVMACYNTFLTPSYMVYFGACDFDGSGSVELEEVLDIYYFVVGHPTTVHGTSPAHSYRCPTCDDISGEYVGQDGVGGLPGEEIQPIGSGIRWEPSLGRFDCYVVWGLPSQIPPHLGLFASTYECEDNCSPCTANNQCSNDEYCARDPEISACDFDNVGSCTPLPANGCKIQGQCSTGAACDYGTPPAVSHCGVGNIGTCQPGCLDDTNCTVIEYCATSPLGYCGAGALGSCESLPGDACHPNTCPMGSACDLTSHYPLSYCGAPLGTCQPGGCHGDYDCYSNYYCKAPAGGVCSPYSIGSCELACYSDDDCGWNTHCNIDYAPDPLHCGLGDVGSCQPGCRDNDDCYTGQLCFINWQSAFADCDGGVLTGTCTSDDAECLWDTQTHPISGAGAPVPPATMGSTTEAANWCSCNDEDILIPCRAANLHTMWSYPEPVIVGSEGGCPW